MPASDATLRTPSVAVRHVEAPVIREDATLIAARGAALHAALLGHVSALLDEAFGDGAPTA